jgi:hypothetical protein
VGAKNIATPIDDRALRAKLISFTCAALGDNDKVCAELGLLRGAGTGLVTALLCFWWPGLES